VSPSPAWAGEGVGGEGESVADFIVDEVGIYNRALTASEIQAIFNAGSGGKCKDPPGPVLTLALTGCTTCSTGDQLAVEATLTPGDTPVTADIYVAIQLPDKRIFFMQGDGSFTAEARPIVSGVTVVPFKGEVFRYYFSGGEPAGSYTWLAALTEAGTVKIIGSIAQVTFTISP